LLKINQQLTRKSNKLRISIYIQLRRQKSNKQKNNIRLKRKKRSSFYYSCKKKKKACKLKILLFKLIITISLLIY